MDSQTTGFACRSDIAAELSERLGVTKAAAKQMALAYEEVVAGMLFAGREIRLPEFGRWHLVLRAQHPAVKRPFEGGELCMIPAHTVIRFTPSRQLKAKVRRIHLQAAVHCQTDNRPHRTQSA